MTRTPGAGMVTAPFTQWNSEGTTKERMHTLVEPASRPEESPGPLLFTVLMVSEDSALNDLPSSVLHGQHAAKSN